MNSMWLTFAINEARAAICYSENYMAGNLSSTVVSPVNQPLQEGCETIEWAANSRAVCNWLGPS
jgi:hypothetical protein